jgi:hypothetical protein
LAVDLEVPQSEGVVPGKIFSVDWRRVRPVTVPSRPQADPYAEDPFFRRSLDAKWNACIGKQGGEQNYLDGYIEAAMELAGAVIDKKGSSAESVGRFRLR